MDSANRTKWRTKPTPSRTGTLNQLWHNDDDDDDKSVKITLDIRKSKTLG